jgi:hypothetical protein
MKFLKNYENLKKLKFFENPFNKDKSVGLKFAPVVELAKLKFTYTTVVE